MNHRFHVIPYGREWKVRKPGAARASRSFPDSPHGKGDAIMYALSRIEKPGEVIVHDRNGMPEIWLTI